jgi:DUF4097 and DUF4098 domain-containing protein YvlB
VTGDVKVQTVDGNVRGEAGGDVRAMTVSGNVILGAHTAKMIEVKTISGDIHLTGGGGEVDITTVSGKATIELADVTRARFKSISGDLVVALGLAPDGQIEGESVSGNISLKFANTPAAEFDVEAFSGDIKNCFGPKPVEARYGPGSRLDFKNGEGHGHVRVNTKSGDVKLCVKGMDSSHVSERTLTTYAGHRLVVPYVF